jgi:polysaccharide biosynthesis transport protein
MNTAIETGPGPIPAAIDILDVLRGVKRRKLMIASLATLAFLIGVAAVTLLKPVYSTEAQVLIENLETPFDRVQSLDGLQPIGVDDRIVTSQMFVLQSEDMGRRVVAALKLEDNPEFNSLLKGIGTLSKFKLALGFGQDPRLKTPEQRALGRYLDELSVYQQTNSNVINIKYSAGNPETAAQVANALADIYVLATRENQSRPAERAREWLSQQIEGLRRKLADTEAAVENFRAKAGLLQGATTTLGTQEISELNTQITLAQGASTEAKARADAIRDLLASQGSVDSSSEVLASPVIQRLKEQRTEATRNIAELSAAYLDNHPKMIAANRELANVDKQIRGEALKIVTGLEEQARIAETREASLRASLEKMKSHESSANLDEVKLKALERDAGADRVLLETMLARYAEASSRQDLTSQPGMARIIQAASAPTSPSFPKRGPMVILITMAGLSVGLGLAFLLEIMSAASRLTEAMMRVPVGQAAAPPDVSQPLPAPPVRMPMQTPPAATAPPLTTLPKAPADATLAVEGPLVDAAATIMSNWAISVRRDFAASRFAVTSISGGTGDCSVAAIALARTLARMGQRVIAVDLSPTGSWLEPLCGVAHGPGLTDLVTGATDFTKVIGRDTKSTAHMLRFGVDRSLRAMALVDEHIEGLLDALGRSYDMIVVNAGEAQPETPVLLHKCHAALLLAPAGRLAEATAAVQALLSTGLRAARHVLIGQSQASASGTADVSPRSVNA